MKSSYHSKRALAAHLRQGGLIAYPTESCYGLGCAPDNRRAVLRLLKLKRRPQHKGLILIAAHYHQLARYVLPLNFNEQKKLINSADHAVSYLLPTRHATPRWLPGKHPTLAVRLTAHPGARQLCRSAGSALVSTSANRSGQRPAKTYAECKRKFGSEVWVLPGKIGKRKQPSMILNWPDGKIVRP